MRVAQTSRDDGPNKERVRDSQRREGEKVKRVRQARHTTEKKGMIHHREERRETFRRKRSGNDAQCEGRHVHVQLNGHWKFQLVELTNPFGTPKLQDTYSNLSKTTFDLHHFNLLVLLAFF